MAGRPRAPAGISPAQYHALDAGRFFEKPLRIYSVDADEDQIRNILSAAVCAAAERAAEMAAAFGIDVAVTTGMVTKGE